MLFPGPFADEAPVPASYANDGLFGPTLMRRILTMVATPMSLGSRDGSSRTEPVKPPFSAPNRTEERGDLGFGAGDGSRTRDIQLGRPKRPCAVAPLVGRRASCVQLSCRRLWRGRWPRGGSWRARCRAPPSAPTLTGSLGRLRAQPERPGHGADLSATTRARCRAFAGPGAWGRVTCRHTGS